MLGKDTAMRLGLIGLGRIGAFHADTLSRLDQVDSLVVTDAVPAVTASVAERFGAESADSPQELISSGVDGIVIAAATDAHTALIRAGVDAGIPVFCEKPLSGVVEEAVAIADYVNKTGVPVQIGYPRRFDPAYLAARNALEAGELGWVHTVRSTTLDPAPPPRGYVAVSGGIFRDCSVHDFDTVRWVTGREVVEVYATGSARGDDFFAELGDVATAQTLLTFDDRATAVVSNTRYNARGHDVRLELHGTVDSVAAGWSQCTPLRNLERDAAWPTGKPWTFFMDRLVDAFRAELTAFTEVVAGKRPTPCSVDDALAVTWIAQAATLSLQQHRPVRIAEVQP
jgi:myo-inositol 2-dehydrogenase / D-chiro-inositol 1-dehydrogenase